MADFEVRIERKGRSKTVVREHYERFALDEYARYKRVLEGSGSDVNFYKNGKRVD